MQQKPFFLAAAFFLLLFSLNIKAQTLTTESVSVFKNGQSFFIKSGKIKAENGIYKMDEKEVPPARFGTLWFSTPNGNITAIKSYPVTEEKTSEQDALLFHDLLSINKGKKIKVFLPDDKIYEGTIVEFTEIKNKTGNFQIMTNSLVTMQTIDNKWVTFYSGQVQQIEFLEKPILSKELKEKITKNILELNFSGNKSEQELNMMYLRNGLTWAPEYLLELNSDKKATLTLQSEIANNGEDLNNVELNLVVGVPNFKFAGQLSYLVELMQRDNTSHQPINRHSQVLSNAISFDPNSYEMNAPSPPPTNPLEGSGTEDFFFYKIDDFSLPKNGRAMQQVFKKEIGIAHVYEMNLPASSTHPSFNDDFFFTPSKEKVFHTIRVNNDTGQPWTTGSVFIVNAEEVKRPISQDMLVYTSHGGHSFIKVTEATDVKIKHAEKETGRAERAKTFPKNSYHYDLVKVEGKIEIRNFKNEAIDLNIRRTITGQILDTNIKWLNQGAMSINGNPNKSNKVCWEMNVGAGETKEVVYSYEVYVRS